MSGSLGSLVVSLSADTGTFSSDMGKAAVIADETSQKMVTSIRKTTPALRELALGASALNFAGLDGLTKGSTVASGAIRGLAGAIGLIGIASWPVLAIVAATTALAFFVGEAGTAAKKDEELAAANQKLADSFNTDKSLPFRQNLADQTYALEQLQAQLTGAQIALIGLQKTQAADAGLSGKAGQNIQAADAAAVAAQQQVILDLQTRIAAQTNQVTEAEKSLAQQRAEAYAAAIKPLTDIQTSLNDQLATYGMTTAQALQYRLTVGDLAGTVKTMGGDTQGWIADVVQAQQVLDDLNNRIQTLTPLTFHVEKLAPVVLQATTQAMDYAEQAQKSIQQTLGTDLADALHGNFNNILQSWIDMLINMVAQAEAASLTQSLFGSNTSTGIGAFLAWLNPTGSTTLSGAATVPVTGHAAGGAISAGGSYLVGESGPERFFPNVPGVVAPNGGGMGGMSVNMSIDARGADVGTAARLISFVPVLRKQFHADVEHYAARGRWPGG